MEAYYKYIIPAIIVLIIFFGIKAKLATPKKKTDTTSTPSTADETDAAPVTPSGTADELKISVYQQSIDTDPSDFAYNQHIFSNQTDEDRLKG